MKKMKLLFIATLIFFATPLFAAKTIVCSTDNTKDSLHVVALDEFGRLLEKYSNGELKAQIHYIGSIVHKST